MLTLFAIFKTPYFDSSMLKSVNLKLFTPSVLLHVTQRSKLSWFELSRVNILNLTNTCFKNKNV